jgi:hypothetical protein
MSHDQAASEIGAPPVAKPVDRGLLINRPA